MDRGSTLGDSSQGKGVRVTTLERLVVALLLCNLGVFGEVELLRVTSVA